MKTELFFNSDNNLIIRKTIKFAEFVPISWFEYLDLEWEEPRKDPTALNVDELKKQGFLLIKGKRAI